MYYKINERNINLDFNLTCSKEATDLFEKFYHIKIIKFILANRAENILFNFSVNGISFGFGLAVGQNEKLDHKTEIFHYFVTIKNPDKYRIV